MVTSLEAPQPIRAARNARGQFAAAFDTPTSPAFFIRLRFRPLVAHRTDDNLFRSASARGQEVQAHIDDAYRPRLSNSDRRAQELPVWLHRYNWDRPHAGIKLQTPASRLGLSEDNLFSLHI